MEAAISRVPLETEAKYVLLSARGSSSHQAQAIQEYMTSRWKEVTLTKILQMREQTIRALFLMHAEGTKIVGGRITQVTGPKLRVRLRSLLREYTCVAEKCEYPQGHTPWPRVRQANPTFIAPAPDAACPRCGEAELKAGPYKSVEYSTGFAVEGGPKDLAALRNAGLPKRKWERIPVDEETGEFQEDIPVNYAESLLRKHGRAVVGHWRFKPNTRSNPKPGRYWWSRWWVEEVGHSYDPAAEMPDVIRPVEVG